MKGNAQFKLTDCRDNKVRPLMQAKECHSRDIAKAVVFIYKEYINLFHFKLYFQNIIYSKMNTWLYYFRTKQIFQ